MVDFKKALQQIPDRVAAISAELNATLNPPPVAPAPPVRFVPEPGLYRRGEIAYELADAVNFSTLKFMRHSAKKYRYARDHGGLQTGSMSLGVYNHIAILEPERFAQDFVIWESTWMPRHGEHNAMANEVTPPGEKKPKRVGAGRPRSGRLWMEFQEKNSGKEIITEKDLGLAMGFRDAVRNDPCIMPLLAVGEPEVAIVWRDPETEILLKGRCDWLGQIMGEPQLEFNSRKVSTDLKGCQDVGSYAFGKRQSGFSTHVQQSMYHDGLLEVTGDEYLMAIAAVEMTQPHDAVPYYLTDHDLEAGRRDYRDWLRTLADCLSSDKYPGQGEGGLRPLQIPSYITDDPDEDTELTSGGLALTI